MSRPRHSAFTLIELLVVIAIAGILAALAIPAIKELGRGNSQRTATRQLLDDVARARQQAIVNRTTVYMVFLPNGYLMPPNKFSALSQVEQDKALKLAPGQGRSYALVSLRRIGDQPGQQSSEYLTPWKTLPQGWIIAPNEFMGPATSIAYTNFDGSMMLVSSGLQWSHDNPDSPILLPFPSAEAPVGEFNLPYIAFSYNGGLESTRNDGGEVIALARGVVDYAVGSDRKPAVGLATISESPPANSLATPYLVFIDGLTGRGRLEQREIE